uniref:Uncharacterized protein n=1 Tax=Anguilla anguilla TaxID=7936 RepID=A0A0E9RYN1_ANGAN
MEESRSDACAVNASSHILTRMFSLVSWILLTVPVTGVNSCRLPRVREFRSDQIRQIAFQNQIKNIVSRIPHR